MNKLLSTKHISLRARSRRVLVASAASFLFSALLAPGILFAQDKSEGLTGLIPGEPPTGLTSDDFQAVPEQWKKWGTESSTLLGKLYGFDPLPLAEQQATIEKLHSQLSLIESENSELLVDLNGKVRRRLALLEAVLLSLEENRKVEKELRPALGKLVLSLEGYEDDDLVGYDDRDVRQHIQKINAITNNNVGPLLDVIRIFYLNYNIRSFVSEPFAESIFYECRRECGPVCDFILGARVRGTQRTNSGVSIDFLPSKDGARFAIQVHGNTTSKTRGVTNQATVYTYGRHRFSGKKIIKFDGDEFSAYKASLSVWPNNKVTGAHLNRRGLIAKLIGDKIAYNQAVNKTPQTEAIAAQRLRSRVLPQFNREVENTFGELNEELKKLDNRLAKESIAPDEKLVRTDTDELRIAYRLMDQNQLAADRPVTNYNSKTGLTIHVHESWINNALPVEGYHLDKPEMSFPEFGEMIAKKFQRVFKLENKAVRTKDDGDRVILSGVDPIHVQFEAGKMKAVMRVGLKPFGRKDIIKLRRIEIPIKIVMTDDKISFKISDDEDDKVRVLPLDPTDRRPISNRIMGAKIRAKFEERMAQESFDRTFDLPINEDGDKKVPVVVDQIHSVNGWLIVVLEEAPQQEEK